MIDTTGKQLIAMTLCAWAALAVAFLMGLALGLGFEWLGWLCGPVLTRLARLMFLIHGR